MKVKDILKILKFFLFLFIRVEDTPIQPYPILEDWGCPPRPS